MDRKRLAVICPAEGDCPHGFTFLEVILALGLFSFGLLAVAGMFGVSLQAIRTDGMRLEALLLAQQGMESFRAQSYDHAAGLPPAFPDGVDGAGGHSKIRQDWKVRRFPGLPGLVLFTVQAKWLERDGRMRSVSYSGLKFKPPPGGEGMP